MSTKVVNAEAVEVCDPTAVTVTFTDVVFPNYTSFTDYNAHGSFPFKFFLYKSHSSVESSYPSFIFENKEQPDAKTQTEVVLDYVVNGGILISTSDLANYSLVGQNFLQTNYDSTLGGLPNAVYKLPADVSLPGFFHENSWLTVRKVKTTRLPQYNMMADFTPNTSGGNSYKRCVTFYKTDCRDGFIISQINWIGGVPSDSFGFIYTATADTPVEIQLEFPSVLFENSQIELPLVDCERFLGDVNIKLFSDIRRTQLEIKNYDKLTNYGLVIDNCFLNQSSGEISGFIECHKCFFPTSMYGTILGENLIFTMSVSDFATLAVFNGHQGSDIYAVNGYQSIFGIEGEDISAIMYCDYGVGVRVIWNSLNLDVVIKYTAIEGIATLNSIVLYSEEEPDVDYGGAVPSETEVNAKAAGGSANGIGILIGTFVAFAAVAIIIWIVVIVIFKSTVMKFSSSSQSSSGL